MTREELLKKLEGLPTITDSTANTEIGESRLYYEVDYPLIDQVIKHLNRPDDDTVFWNGVNFAWCHFHSYPFPKAAEGLKAWIEDKLPAWTDTSLKS